MSTAVALVRPYAVAALLGGAVGLVSAAFLGAVHVLQRLVWDVVPATLPWWQGHRAAATLLTCTLGGLLVGLVNRGAGGGVHAQEGPHDLEESLVQSEDPRTGGAALARLATLGVVSLGFGAALGPEAPLIALVAGMAANLRGVLHLARDEAVQLSLAAALGGLFGAPLGAVAMPVEKASPPVLRERVARIAPSLLAAIAGLWVLLLILPEGSLHPLTFAHTLALPQTGRPGLEVLAWIGAAAVGGLAGWALLLAIPALQHRVARAIPALPLRGMAGGLVLGIMGAITPLALFSGHEGIQHVYNEVATIGAWALVGLALVKAVALVACLATGWFGGQIFPAAMVGTTLGLAVAALFGGDAVAGAAAAGLVAASAVLMQRPVAALLVFLFFLPGGTLVASALGAAVGALVLALAGRGGTGRARAH
ncbi:chloride channel protein [Sphingomicrobium aestuariivivum]|uniref:chloride channel protein n=1 Tax=Sphingomicrobium aestuariivivum TaxID=1582356 RepID=UPI001FD6B18C|nr:chloride channel protein [Sphingomicrobium aestuariivivum]MCJ8191398.1 chloride channel protein [Sphingomicrobium aestuariivivum]